jgi:hypothetical protein
MSWTHRVAKVTTNNGDVYYDVREYYDLPDGPAWSLEARPAYGEDIDDLIRVLRWMLLAAEKAKKYPALVLNLHENGEAV